MGDDLHPSPSPFVKSEVSNQFMQNSWNKDINQNKSQHCTMNINIVLHIKAFVCSKSIIFHEILMFCINEGSFKNCGHFTANG